jgi:hypothetical protein
VLLDFQPGGFWKAGGDRLPGVRAETRRPWRSKRIGDPSLVTEVTRVRGGGPPNQMPPVNSRAATAARLTRTPYGVIPSARVRPRKTSATPTTGSTKVKSRLTIAIGE